MDKRSEEEQKQVTDDFSDTLNKIKEVLKEEVKEVRLSQRLTDSPACIVLDVLLNKQNGNPPLQFELLVRA